VQAIILAGGLGTRLRPLVSDIPKPMAEVAGRPFMEYLLLQLRRAGVTRVVICAGFKAEPLNAYFGDGSRWGAALEYSIEPEPLGTAGALKLAEPLLSGDRWLVMNGDSFLDISLAGLAEAHRRTPAPATIALARVADVQRYGSVNCAEDGSLTRFVEKGHSTGPGLVNGGIYVIERRTLELIPDRGATSLERDVLPQLVGRGLRGVQSDAFFIDIGVPEDFLRAQQLGDLFAPPGAPG
jgi:NDP-sugar pyrophosphorylase family protein